MHPATFPSCTLFDSSAFEAKDSLHYELCWSVQLSDYYRIDNIDKLLQRCLSNVKVLW